MVGVEEKTGAGGAMIPEMLHCERDVDTEWDLKLIQKLAVSFELNQAILLEGRSSIGKPSTAIALVFSCNRFFDLTI